VKFLVLQRYTILIPTFFFSSSEGTDPRAASPRKAGTPDREDAITSRTRHSACHRVPRFSVVTGTAGRGTYGSATGSRRSPATPGPTAPPATARTRRLAPGQPLNHHASPRARVKPQRKTEERERRRLAPHHILTSHARPGCRVRLTDGICQTFSCWDLE
jgi:hypothetical protein